MLLDSFRDETLKTYRAVVPKWQTAGSIFANRGVVCKFGVAGTEKQSLSSAKLSLSSQRHQKTILTVRKRKKQAPACAGLRL